MKKFLVIGNPIEHSLSPKLHNYWIKNNGIDAIYEKKKLDENDDFGVISPIHFNGKGDNYDFNFRKYLESSKANKNFLKKLFGLFLFFPLYTIAKNFNFLKIKLIRKNSGLIKFFIDHNIYQKMSF